MHKFNNNNKAKLTMSTTTENVKAPRAPRKPTIVGKNKQILLALIAVSEEAEVDFDSLLEVFGLNSETLKDAVQTNEAFNAKTAEYEAKFAELTGKRVRKPKGEAKKPRKPKAAPTTEAAEKPARKPRSDKGKPRTPPVAVVEIPAEIPPVSDIETDYLEGEDENSTIDPAEMQAATDLYTKAKENLAARGVEPYEYKEEKVEEAEPEPIQVVPQKRKYTRKPKA